MDLSKANKVAMITTGIKIGVPVVALGVGVILIKRMFKKNPDGTSTKVAPSLKDTVICDGSV